jgi:hypothetical protein
MTTFRHPLTQVPVQVNNVVFEDDAPKYAFGTTAFGYPVYIPRAMATRMLLRNGMNVVLDIMPDPGEGQSFRAVRACPNRFFPIENRRNMRGNAAWQWATENRLDRIYDDTDRGSFTAEDLHVEVFGRLPDPADHSDQRNYSEILFWLLGQSYEGRLHETRVIRPGSRGIAEVWFSLQEDDALPMGAFER